MSRRMLTKNAASAPRFHVTGFLRDEGFAVTVTEDEDGYRIDAQRGA